MRYYKKCFCFTVLFLIADEQLLAIWWKIGLSHYISVHLCNLCICMASVISVFLSAAISTVMTAVLCSQR